MQIDVVLKPVMLARHLLGFRLHRLFHGSESATRFLRKQKQETRLDNLESFEHSDNIQI